jgi:hypothetical protein
MGKIGCELLFSLLLGLRRCTSSSNFKVHSCNNPDTGGPEMTISENNQTRIIEEKDLTLRFTDDEIILAYGMKNTYDKVITQFDKESVQITFDSQWLLFQCKYRRDIRIQSVSEVYESDQQLINGVGTILYNMTITGGVLGDTTTVNIFPSPGLPSFMDSKIYPIIKECRIIDESSTNQLFLIHSTSCNSSNEQVTCFENQQLGVKQINFEPDIKFSFTTFSFVGSTGSQKQKQTIKCLIHLESTSSNTQAPDCTQLETCTESQTSMEQQFTTTVYNSITWNPDMFTVTPFETSWKFVRND